MDIELSLVGQVEGELLEGPDPAQLAWQSSLLGSNQASGGATLPSLGAPPCIEHIEQRGVAAAFLQHITAMQLRDGGLAKEASQDAVDFLKKRIESVEKETAGASARALETREAEAAAAPDQREVHKQAAEQAKQELRKQERALRQHKADLAKRESSPYLTSRDVHGRHVVPETSAAMCRYVELEHVRTGWDEVTRQWYVGPARYFFSYSWDSPWEDVVSALVAHTHTFAVEEAR